MATRAPLFCTRQPRNSSETGGQGRKTRSSPKPEDTTPMTPDISLHRAPDLRSEDNTPAVRASPRMPRDTRSCENRSAHEHLPQPSAPCCKQVEPLQAADTREGQD